MKNPLFKLLGVLILSLSLASCGDDDKGGDGDDGGKKQARGSFTGTWSGTGTMNEPTKGISNCQKVSFKLRESPTEFELTSGQYNCGSDLYVWSTVKVQRNGNELISNGNVIGTLVNSTLSVAITLGNGDQIIIRATVFDNKLELYDAYYDSGANATTEYKSNLTRQ